MFKRASKHLIIRKFKYEKVLGFFKRKGEGKGKNQNSLHTPQKLTTHNRYQSFSV